MQAPQPSISGTRDYAGGDAVALQTARDAIEAALRRYAYAPINPPILESPLPFLNRSGEDIRRHMYIFPDPGGIEVCLRPELTIPVCRAYLRQLQTAGSAAEKSSGPEARLCYFGPAFTYELANDRRYRQFYQAGAEFIGAPDRESADAEILAAALDALEAAGLKETRIEIGDVEISQRIHRSAPGQRAFEDAHPADRAAQPERTAHRRRAWKTGDIRCNKRVRRACVAAGLGGARQGRASDPRSLRAGGCPPCRRTHAGGNCRAPDQPHRTAGGAGIGRADAGRDGSPECPGQAGDRVQADPRAFPQISHRLDRSAFWSDATSGCATSMPTGSSRWTCNSMSGCAAASSITPAFCSRFTPRISPRSATSAAADDTTTCSTARVQANRFRRWDLASASTVCCPPCRRATPRRG